MEGQISIVENVVMQITVGPAIFSDAANRTARLMDADDTETCVSPGKMTRETVMFPGLSVVNRSASSVALSIIRPVSAARSFGSSPRYCSSPAEVTRICRCNSPARARFENAASSPRISRSFTQIDGLGRTNPAYRKLSAPQSVRV